MQSESLISAAEAFQLMCEGRHCAVLDVRSQGEFEAAHFRGTSNIPILNDEHRHQVGLTYKVEGSNRAQELGYKLVSGAYREQLIRAWCDELDRSLEPALVFCWRGGLRSQIAQEWLHSKQRNVLRVEGGYKSLRAEALQALNRSRDYVLLSGPTGSGKTVLLKQVPGHIDLERLANHRGSAFGLRLDDEQPTQTNFENDLAQALYLLKGKVILEDESRFIGHRHLCDELYSQMSVAPIVLLQVDIKERALHIFEEYVLEAQEDGQSPIKLHEHYKACVNRIRKTLGGLQADQCLNLLNTAFEVDEISAHLEWIEFLLKTYYDKLYAFSLAKKNRKILFEGNRTSCLEFLIKQGEVSS